MNKVLKITTLFAMTLSLTTISSFSQENNPEKINTITNTQALLNMGVRQSDGTILIKLPKGVYNFNTENCVEKEYYVSNHDQVNPKRVGIALEELDNVIIDGQGSTFIFHGGPAIAIAIKKCKKITIKNLNIDYKDPMILQFDVVNKTEDNKGLIATFNADRYKNGCFIRKELGKDVRENFGGSLVFNEKKQLVYRMSDTGWNVNAFKIIEPGKVIINQHTFLPIGTRIAMRSWFRPTPGIFITESVNTTFENVSVHYAEGMGLLAQMSENIYLKGFNICLNTSDASPDKKRFFTAQADATHFSACKGEIISENGLYEGMSDDAINVHGTYLKVVKRVNDRTLRGRYMHNQAWGFLWGEVGDEVQFVESRKMELDDCGTYKITSIKTVDKQTIKGAKEFEITFDKDLPANINENGSYGIENLTWTPTVIFRGNTVRNNRARGALFSTPKKVICENNIFDHTHGTAILLCGDCNGWFETGACKDVIIRNNKFINALTSNYQFTTAVISIYPEIPNLKEQKKFFHSNIIIENNTFEVFDSQLLYAKSVDGLIFRNNKIIKNNDYKPYHWNRFPFLLEKVNNVEITNNTFSKEFEKANNELIKVDMSLNSNIKIENNISK